MNTEFIKLALENAPIAANVNPDIYGFVVKDEANRLFVCARCGARMMARGCWRGTETERVVWRDEKPDASQCVGCDETIN
jgi:hypothetical protein